MDIKRIEQVLRWNVTAYKGELMTFFYRSLAVFGIFTLMNNFGAWISQSADIQNTISTASISVVALIVLLVFSASRVCFNMKTRTEFISYTMLPATKGEKFIVNIVYQTFMVLGFTLAGLLAVDVVQALISLVVAHEAHSLTWAVMGVMCHPFEEGFMSGMLSYAALVLFHSIYVLGGTFFRKHQFLYTTLAHMVISFILSMLAVSLLGGVAYFTQKHGYNIHVEWIVDDIWIDIIAFVFILLVSACFYRLAFRFYCRMQVINNKYFN